MTERVIGLLIVVGVVLLFAETGAERSVAWIGLHLAALLVGLRHLLAPSWSKRR